MPAPHTHLLTARGRSRSGRRAGVVSLEHIMALAADLHHGPVPAVRPGTAPAPHTPVRISPEEWALLFPAWPATPASAAA